MMQALPLFSAEDLGEATSGNGRGTRIWVHGAVAGTVIATGYDVPGFSMHWTGWSWIELRGATVNMAGYIAVREALNVLCMADFRGRIVLYHDNELVVNQLSGAECHGVGLRTLRDYIQRRVVPCFDAVQFVWVPKEDNVPACRQATRALAEARRRQIWESASEQL